VILSALYATRVIFSAILALALPLAVGAQTPDSTSKEVPHRLTSELLRDFPVLAMKEASPPSEPIGAGRGPATPGAPVSTPSSDLAGSIQPTRRGVQLRADWAGYRVDVHPKLSEDNELSLGGAIASTLLRGAAGVRFLVGAEERDVLATGAWQLSHHSRLLISTGLLQQQVPMLFDSGIAHVRITQHSAGMAYQIATDAFLEHVDVNIHGSRSGTRDLGSQEWLRRTGGQEVLERLPMRVAGGSVIGFGVRATLKPYARATISGQLGGEHLVYDLAAGRDATSRITMAADWTQQLGNGFRLTAGGSSHAAQRTVTANVAHSLADHQFGLTITRIVGRDGSPSDTQVRGNYTLTWGHAAPAGATSGREVRTYAGRDLLELVSARPSFMPAHVIARVDSSVTPTRLVVLASDALPAGARVDPVTAAVTLPEVVTQVVWITRNGVPMANTGQFVVIAGHLEIRPAAMEPPTGADTYIVTLDNADGAVTTVTVSVSVGSVRIDRIIVSTDRRRETPEALAFVSQHDVPLNTLLTSNAVRVSGINVPVTIAVTQGEYALDDRPFTTAPGQVSEGQTVRVQHYSAATTATTRTTTLTIGGTSSAFASTTEADTVPALFAFPSVDDADLREEVTSEEVSIAGIDGPTPISVRNGSYAVNDGAFTSQTGTVTNGQRVRVRLTTGGSYQLTESAILTVGGMSAMFTVTTTAADREPAAFSFDAQHNIALNASVVSNVITVDGISDDLLVPIFIVGGEYAVSGSPYTTMPGFVTHGQTVTVRVTSASTYSTTTTATVSIANVSKTFSVTTRPPDITPDAFAFTAQQNVPVNALVASNAIMVSGIEAAATISVSGGDYAINGGAYTSATATVANGHTVTVRQRSSNQFSTASTLTLTIGGVSAAFTVRTQSPDTTSDMFSFTAQTGVAVSTAIISNTITIAGINGAATVTVTGGEYSTQGNSFSSTAGTINPGGTLRLRQTSSASFATTTTMTVTVGGVSATFSVATAAIDPTPDAFSFSPETNVNLNQTRTSNAITVTGINSPATISISGAATREYRINNGAWVASAGTVINGDTVRVRHTSAATNSTTTSTTLTIDGVSGTFSTTTKP
jgi:hypothetical protein